ncbi:MAG: hypothetical protein QM652_07320 [Legionella sp.]|uniref:hypothetical protein n=1 Tax=Legionella sp. TaxID=459 RepID=UPI0039E429C9
MQQEYQKHFNEIPNNYGDDSSSRSAGIESTITQELRPEPKQCNFKVNDVPLDINDFVHLENAMEAACLNHGYRYLASHYESKNTLLTELLKQFKENYSDLGLWEQAYANVINFMRFASEPRGGCVNFFKARYGETASAKAFYTMLNQEGLQWLSKYIQEEVALPDHEASVPERGIFG